MGLYSWQRAHRALCALLVVTSMTAAATGLAWAQPPSVSAVASEADADPKPQPKAPPREWIAPPPHMWGRIGAAQLGLVINTQDPYSVEVGEYYAKVRGLSAQQILRVALPVRSELTREEFEAFARRVQGYFGESTQALALAWVQPYAAGCNSLNGALALGYDERLCGSIKASCGPSRLSPYFNSPTVYPYTQLGVRPSMLIAASSVQGAKALIDRGAASDGSLTGKRRPAAQVHFVTTSDAVRSVRSWLFPPEGLLPDAGVEVHLDHTDALKNADRVLMYLTGRVAVDDLDTVRFLPGALADHLTSHGGQLTDPLGQMSALKWIDAGATASYGTVGEPCSHLTKFPHPQLLLLRYLQGATALEAYWKSVAWPQQGVFIGDPLAAPFAAR